jgi:hypothetical protein
MRAGGKARPGRICHTCRRLNPATVARVDSNPALLMGTRQTPKTVDRDLTGDADRRL